MLLVQLVSELFFSYVLEHSQIAWFGWRRIVILMSLVAAISMVSSFNLLKYFAWKKLWWTFSGCLLTTAVSLTYTYITYLTGTGAVSSETFIAAYYAVWSAIAIFGLSILLSKARRDFWLLIYAVVIFLFSTSTVLVVYLAGEDYSGNWGYVAGYTYIISSVLLCLNMSNELRRLKPDNDGIIDD